MQSILWTIGATGFIFLMTCLGSATVLLFQRSSDIKIKKVMLGFAAGVMIAVSVWSLLIPAIENTKNNTQSGWFSAAGGFILGILLLLILDRFITHSNFFKTKNNNTTGSLLFFALTLHNIPEGMAVGLSFAIAQQSGNLFSYTSALALTLGIGIQNFPEGMAVSLPLIQEGATRKKAFIKGCISGAVEPVFGILTALIAIWVAPIMPWLLSSAAGAMIYVVIKELIPEAMFGKHCGIGALGVISGFVIMIALDTLLG